MRICVLDRRKRKKKKKQQQQQQNLHKGKIEREDKSTDQLKATNLIVNDICDYWRGVMVSASQDAMGG